MGDEWPAGAPAGAVFLSYASQDGEAAQRICDALRAAGIEVWFDKSELRGGDAWDRRIREQIQACRLFIPLISAHTEARDEGYFRREWSLASDRTRDMSEKKAFLIPVVIDGTPERGASVPEKFHQIQWTRLPQGVTPPAFATRIAALLAASGPLATANAPHPAPAGAPAPASAPVSTSAQAPRGAAPSDARNRRAAPLAVGLALLAAIVGGGWLVLHRSGTNRHAEAGASAPSQPVVMEKSIAVLPFVDLSEKHDQEYFADGIAEETLNQLARIPGLKVIGRTSSFQFRGKAEDLRAIGATLGAAYVLEGSIRRSGDRIRVTAQLIATRDGAHRWSDTYDRSASDILGIQDEIAAGLARALQLEVATGSRKPPRDPEAYDLYLRGLHAMDRYDEGGFDEALAEFRQSLQLDPEFVPAAEALARVLLFQAMWYMVPPRRGFEQARDATMAVLKRDPSSALAHALLSSIHTWYDWDWRAAEEESGIALKLAPNDPMVLGTAAEDYLAVGRWSDTIRLAIQAIAVDPLDAGTHEDAGWGYQRSGRLQEAAAEHRRSLDISPTFAGSHHDLGLVLLLEGKPEAALAEMQKEPLPGWRAAGMAVAYQALHRSSEANAQLAKLEAEHSADMAMIIAEVHAFRGEKGAALAWLDRAYSQKDVFLWMIKGDPLLANLGADPRYQAFLRKMNVSQ